TDTKARGIGRRFWNDPPPPRRPPYPGIYLSIAVKVSYHRGVTQSREPCRHEERLIDIVVGGGPQDRISLALSARRGHDVGEVGFAIAVEIRNDGRQSRASPAE